MVNAVLHRYLKLAKFRKPTTQTLRRFHLYPRCVRRKFTRLDQIPPCIEEVDLASTCKLIVGRVKRHFAPNFDGS